MARLPKYFESMRTYPSKDKASPATATLMLMDTIFLREALSAKGTTNISPPVTAITKSMLRGMPPFGINVFILLLAD